MAGGIGTSTNLVRNPANAKRHKDFLRREEKRWAAKSGPVKVRYVDPASLRPGSGQAGADSPD